MIGTRSLSAVGSAVLVDGTRVSLGCSRLVVGASTISLGSAARVSGGDLGGLVMNGGGGGEVVEWVGCCAFFGGRWEAEG